MTDEAVLRLRAVQDMVRLLLGNAEAIEADALIIVYAVDNAGSVR